MTRTGAKLGLLTTLTSLSVMFNFSSAAYEPRLVLKYPFLSEHSDSLGNLVEDSLVRNRAFDATLYRTGMSDSLTVQGVTNDSGLSVPQFDRWPSDDSLVDSTSIGRLDISLPNTYRATQVGDGFTFEPLRIESVPCFGRTAETIDVVLPLSVAVQEFTIGSGAYAYDLVVLADCHVAEGKKQQGGYADFGTQGWDDCDNDPQEKPPAVQEVEACRSYINGELTAARGYDLRFVVLAGDVTSTSERSEYQRIRQILAGLDERPSGEKLFVVPLMGNHDGWPYVGSSSGYDEQPSTSVGGKLGTQY
jgi:hypothetical protein